MKHNREPIAAEVVADVAVADVAAVVVVDVAVVADGVVVVEAEENEAAGHVSRLRFYMRQNLSR